MPPEPVAGEACGRESETRVETQGPPVEVGSTIKRFCSCQAFAPSLFILPSQKQVVSLWIACGCRCQHDRFARRELRAQSIADFLRDFALDGEDVSQVAVVVFCPNAPVRTCINELNVYTHSLAILLHGSLQNRGDTEFLRDALQVPGLAPILLGGNPRDDLQVCHTRELGQDLVLNTFGEVGVALVGV